MNTRDDVKTLAYVLRRTNYGEADRILNLITPAGKMSAIAKGVRKEKSKLAGGVEMFSLTLLNIHKGKGDLCLITSAKMQKFYSKILSDLRKMELGSMILKKISLAAESSDSPEYFKITDTSLAALNDDVNADLVESWFLINLAKVMGEEINLYRDADDKELDAKKKYHFDFYEKVFVNQENGEFGVEEIKLMRMMATMDLKIITRVKNVEMLIPKILNLVRSVIK